jgi:uncharacterized protein (TIGR03643 family)
VCSKDATLFIRTASLAAIPHFFPILRPLLAPGKWPTAYRANLCGQILLFVHGIKTRIGCPCLNAMKHTDRDIDRIIEMAWEDRTPFDAIEAQFGLPEKDVIKLMRRQMKPGSFKLWRARVQGRKTKHSARRDFSEGRHKSSMQRHITGNKISKR